MNIHQHFINEFGDLVYCKCCDSHEWKEPGTVVGKENKDVSKTWRAACKHTYMSITSWK